MILRALFFFGLLTSLVGCPSCRKSDNSVRPVAPDLSQIRSEIESGQNAEFPGRGITDYGSTEVADIPKSYAMVVLSELAVQMKTSGASSARLKAAIRWIKYNSDLNHDGVIGWGVPIAWDAYGDGSVNPANTEYTISTGIVMHALLDWIEQDPKADADAVIQLLISATEPYLRDGVLTPDGLLPYSLREVDRKYDTFNPAAYMAGQMQRLSHYVKSAPLRTKMRSVADLTMKSLLNNKKVSASGAWYWNYSISENVPNDMPHAGYIIDGIRNYKHWNGKHGDDFLLSKINAHLEDFVGAGDVLRAWPVFRSEISSPPRLYDIGMALYLSCTSDLRKFRDTLIRSIPSYRTPEGRYAKYPVAFETPLIVNEYESYIVRTAATCELGQTQNIETVFSQLRYADLPVRNDLSEAVTRLAGAAVDWNSGVEVPFLNSHEMAGAKVFFHPTRKVSEMRGSLSFEFSEAGIPLKFLKFSASTWLVVFKTIPLGELKLMELRSDGTVVRTLTVQHAPDRNAIFRAAMLDSGILSLVYFDNVSSANYLVQVSGANAGAFVKSAPITLPSFGDPAGLTYEMIPAVFLSKWNGKLHLFAGNLSAIVSNSSVANETRLSNCVRVVEAVVATQGPAALCQTKETSGRGPMGIFSYAGVELHAIQAESGIPWNLTSASPSGLEYAKSPEQLREMYLFDWSRMAASGWLEFGENNVEGRIAWSQIYYLNGLLDILEIAKRSPVGLEIYGPLIRGIRQRLDLEVGLIGEMWLQGHYKTRAFTVDRSLALFAVQTSRVLLLMERYLRVVPAPLAQRAADGMRTQVLGLQNHIEVLATTGESGDWIRPGTPHLRWPKGSAFSFDGLGVPYNHQNEWAYAHFKSSGANRNTTTATEIVEHFLRLETNQSYLPKSGVWSYWWGKAFDGWKASENISTNRPKYPGDKIKAWISFRSIDTFAILTAIPTLAASFNRETIFESATDLVREGRVYPFVSAEILSRDRLPILNRSVVNEYARVSSPWELANSPWAILGAASQ